MNVISVIIGIVALVIALVGFIPLLDCAPLVVAAEKGFAAAEGLDITLVRETSWANIRDRVVVGHFELEQSREFWGSAMKPSRLVAV